jgi:hypothetical protein
VVRNSEKWFILAGNFPGRRSSVFQNFLKKSFTVFSTPRVANWEETALEVFSIHFIGRALLASYLAEASH